MFRKQPSLANQSPIKSSARRALAQEISERYGVAQEQARTLLPDGLKQCKGTTSAGQAFTLYISPEEHHDPLAFRLGKGDDGALVPTLYMIWQATASPTPSTGLGLPVLVTNDMVMEKLAGGADLMLRGITARSLQALPDDLPAGTVVGVGTLSVPGAIRAVGMLASSSSDLRRSDAGKAVEILHLEGDHIWALGSKITATPVATPTNGDSPRDQSDEVSQDGQAEGRGLPDISTLNVNENEKESTQQQGDAAEPQEGRVLTASEVDTALRDALLYAISQRLAKESSAFPMSASKFVDSYLLPSRRATLAGQEISIKKSSYKNAGAFLKQAKKDNLISTKEAKGSEVNVIGVNVTHPDVKAFKPFKTIQDLQKQEKKREVREEQQNNQAAQRSVEVSQLYKPHGSSVNLAKEIGFESDSYILPAELRSAINEYITQADLINQHDAKYVNLDDSLSAALLKKGENLGFLPRSELLDRLLNSMQAWYRLLIRENGKVEEILTKGTPQKIAVSVKKRQGKKLVTIIDGTETFRIPSAKLAEDLQLKCASSATVSELPQSSAKKPLFEVVVQGSQTSIVVRELVDTWGVPKAWIEVSK